MDPSKPSFTARITSVLMNLSMMIGMVVLASLLGIAGATVFIYRQMGNPHDVTAARPQQLAKHGDKAAVSTLSQPKAAPAVTTEPVAAPAASDEWHFAEFSDQPRYIDVTYDEGRKHARLKVNTVLSTRPDVASVPAESAPVFSDDPTAYNDSQPNLSDPGSRLITDPRTGRIIGVDGSAGAAAEARRVQSAPPVAPPIIRNPKPEVRVASPVTELGRPVFGSEFRSAQVTTPVSTYLPSRKALPVDPELEDATSSTFNVDQELMDTSKIPARAALPVLTSPRTNRENRWFSSPDSSPTRR